MRPIVLTYLALLALALPAPAGSAVTRDVSFPLSAGQRVKLEFPTGTLRIEPSDGDRVQVRTTLRCDRDDDKCAERAQSIEVVSVSSSSTLRVKLQGWPPRWNPLGLHLETVARVPRARALDVTLGVGQLEVKDHRGDLAADVGVGDAIVTAARSDARRVRLEVGVGDARLNRGGETIGGAGFIGHVVDWDQGKGRSELRVKVGVGKVEVTLR